jgi:hypothetical protein
MIWASHSPARRAGSAAEQPVVAGGPLRGAPLNRSVEGPLSQSAHFRLGSEADGDVIESSIAWAAAVPAKPDCPAAARWVPVHRSTGADTGAAAESALLDARTLRGRQLSRGAATHQQHVKDLHCARWRSDHPRGDTSRLLCTETRLIVAVACCRRHCALQHKHFSCH